MKIPEGARLIARWCDDSIPVTDFNYHEESLHEYEGLFYLYTYGDFIPTSLNGWVQSEYVKQISADKATEWLYSAFDAGKAARLAADIEKIRTGRA